MGLSTRIITSDFPAEMQVDERLYTIDRDRGLFAAPRAHMLLFFLDVDHEVQVEGERGPWVLRRNDACLLPAGCARTYRPRQRGKVSRMHVLRVIWHFAEDLGLPSVGTGFVEASAKTAGNERPSREGRGTRPASTARAKRRVISLERDNEDERSWMRSQREARDFTFEFGPNGLDFLREFTRRPRLIQGGVTPALHERLREIRREFDERPHGYKLRIAALMLDVAVGCARAAMAQEAAPESMSPPPPVAGRGELLMRRTKEFLFENHRRALTLDDVARHLRLSPEHVSRVFRQMTGMTVFDYLRFVRVDMAQQLLADSSRPVADVARAVGFSTPTLFGRAFKRETRLTPQVYRQRVLAQTHFKPSVQV